MSIVDKFLTIEKKKNNKMQDNGYIIAGPGLVCELCDNNVRKFYYYELVETAVRNVVRI